MKPADFDCLFLSVEIPADFLNLLGYQLIFLIRCLSGSFHLLTYIT
jgi:hypothetical protein